MAGSAVPLSAPPPGRSCDKGSQTELGAQGLEYFSGGAGGWQAHRGVRHFADHDESCEASPLHGQQSTLEKGWNADNGAELQQERIRSGSKAEVLTPVVTLFNNKWKSTNLSIMDLQCHPLQADLIVACYWNPAVASLDCGSFSYSNSKGWVTSSGKSPGSSLFNQTHSSLSPDTIDSSQSQTSRTEENTDPAVVVWSTQGQQVSILQSEHRVTSLAWDPANIHVLSGGTQLGQILIWDTRAGRCAIQKSKLISARWQGHLDMVNNLTMVDEGESGKLVSTCKAGRLCTWTRRMLDKPLTKLELRQPGSSEDSINLVTQWNVVPTCLSFAHGDRNTFFLGTESGQLYQGTLNGSPEADLPGLFRQIGPQSDQRRVRRWSGEGFMRSSRHLANRRPSGAEAHRGLISGLHCHPGTQQVEGLPDVADLMLTSSWDWTFKLWSAHNPSRPLWSVEYLNACHDVQWSPRDPFAFAVLSADDNRVQLWHLGASLNGPVGALPLRPTTTTTHRGADASSAGGGRLRWTSDGRQIVCADLRGRIHVVGAEAAQEAFGELPSDALEAVWEKVEELRTRSR